MKSIFKNIILGMIAIVLFPSCEEKDERVHYPHSTPIIEDAIITSLNNSSTIIAGDSIEFTATVSDPVTPLSTIEVKIIINDRLVAKEKLRTKNKSAVVSAKYKIPFYPELNSGTYPEVYLTLENVEGDITELKLPNDKNVVVDRPVFGDKLYMVDEKTQTVLEMNKVDGSEYDYEIPSGSYGKTANFKIAEKLSADGKSIDYTGFVWGEVNDHPAIIENEQSSSLVIDNSLITAIRQISFNIFSFEYVLDAEWFNPMTIAGIEFKETPNYSGYTTVEMAFTNGNEYKFSGFNDLEKTLNPDFFEFVSNTKAKFKGLTGTYSLYYQLSTGFMYVEQATAVYPDAMWICGTGLGFPQPTYTATTKWDWTQPTDYIFCRKVSAGVFEATFYAGNSYDMKFFHQRTWGGEVKSNEGYILSPASMIIPGGGGTPNGNCESPAGFTTGVYKVKLDMNAKTIQMEKIN